ncbi:hypothetical protein [Kineosporia sp. NBRC 101731]|uniref:hypothetical protein n=1 Tax=Kineosporia sp. NBRC 101731 TaxID=3032199 RepID=UPI0024A48F83|nr:hypothetical protein [Kineosporia sp. NBRC 101731]GLY28354.1 hypothetical protein Kisp02_17190 [Kineosporia sp. NBRC 101731]
MPSNVPLTLGGRLVALGGTLFLLDTFLPWHRKCFGLFGTEVCDSESAWGTPFSALAALLVLALVAEVVAVQVVRVRLPDLGGAGWGTVRLGVAGTATALVLLQLLVGADRLGPSYGISAGLVLVAVLAVGTYLRRAESAPVLQSAHAA